MHQICTSHATYESGLGAPCYKLSAPNMWRVWPTRSVRSSVLWASVGCAMFRFGHNRIPAPYMTICMHGNSPAKNTVRTYVHRMYRVGHNRIYTPYMTVYFVISLPKFRIYTVYIWFWPTLQVRHFSKIDAVSWCQQTHLTEIQHTRACKLDLLLRQEKLLSPHRPRHPCPWLLATESETKNLLPY